MQYFEQTIAGIDGTAASFRGYIIDNSEEVLPDRRRPAVLVIPGGGYEMTSDREAEPIALKMLAFGFHAFILRYSVAPSRYPVALLEAADSRACRRMACRPASGRGRRILGGWASGGKPGHRRR